MLTNSYYHGKGYVTAGINPNDLVATFGLPGMLSSEFTVYHGLERTGCAILPIGIVDDPRKIVDLVRDLGASVFLVMPSDLIPVIQLLENCGEKLPNIRLVVTGGEAIYESQKSRFAAAIGNPSLRFRSTFQASDTGTIGFQCDHLDGSEYHVHEELQYVEILDGKLVVTNMNRYLMPVIRMETGDIAEWSTKDPENERCACGRTARVIRHLGRDSDHLKIGGEKFKTQIFLDLMNAYEIPAEQYAVVIHLNDKGQDQIDIAVGQNSIQTFSSGSAVKYLCSRNAKFDQQLRRGIVSQPTVRLICERDKAYSGTGKRKFVVDLRSPNTPQIHPKYAPFTPHA